MGGSQLNQLAASLRTSGLARSNSNSTEKGKKSHKRKLSTITPADRSELLNKIKDKYNKFDIKETRLKHDVGGRNIKGAVGRPGLRRSEAEEYRKATLLPRLDQRNRAGGIIDKRFGEKDDTLTNEEKMLERFTKERMRSAKGSKKSLFNLEDEEAYGDDLGLTHFGQSVNDMDDFPMEILDDEDEMGEGRGGQIDRRTVSSAHFGGFGEQEQEMEDSNAPPKKKTKAEVMAEVMQKSKAYKHARQEQAAEDAEIRADMDGDLQSIRDLIYGMGAADSGNSNMIPLGVKAVKAKDDYDDYDMHLAAIAKDRRAAPTDRMQTAEEIALKEKEELEELERRRIARMNGEDEEENAPLAGKNRKKRKHRAEADDLEDDFNDDDEEWDGLGTGLAVAGQHGAPATNDEENSDSEHSASEEDLDADEPDEEIGTESEEEEENPEELDADMAGELGQDLGDTEAESYRTPISSNPHKRSNKGNSETKSLPYTFKMPSSHDEFLDIIAPFSSADLSTIIDRIRKVHHQSLGEGNKAALAKFSTILMDHFLYICEDDLDDNGNPNFKLLQQLTSHIYSLGALDGIQLGEHTRNKLKLIHSNLCFGLKTPLEPEARTWPGLTELLFLRLIGTVWSTSDKIHAVAAPASLLIGTYLGQCRIRSMEDIGSGLFLTSVWLSFEQHSQRLAPEIFNFLMTVLVILLSTEGRAIPGSNFIVDAVDGYNSDLRLENNKKSKNLKVSKPSIAELLDDDCHDIAQRKVDVCGMCLNLVEAAAASQTHSDAYVELVKPMIELLSSKKLYCKALQSLLDQALATLSRTSRLASSTRNPLELQAHKPIPIASHVPKFNAGYSHDRHYDPDQERAATAKLKAEYKQEKKGTIREIRKDARFLAAEQQRRVVSAGEEYEKSMRSKLGKISQERGAQKVDERARARIKRRAGGK